MVFSTNFVLRILHKTRKSSEKLGNLTENRAYLIVRLCIRAIQMLLLLPLIVLQQLRNCQLPAELLQPVFLLLLVWTELLV